MLYESWDVEEHVARISILLCSIINLLDAVVNEKLDLHDQSLP
jgi:hypothetical protein